MSVNIVSQFQSFTFGFWSTNPPCSAVSATAELLDNMTVERRYLFVVVTVGKERCINAL